MCGSLPVSLYICICLSFFRTQFFFLWVRVSLFVVNVWIVNVFLACSVEQDKGSFIFAYYWLTHRETWCWSIQANGFNTLPHTNTQLKSKHKRNRFSYFLHIQTFLFFISFTHCLILLLAVSRPIHVTWLISMSRVKDRIYLESITDATDFRHIFMLHMWPIYQKKNFQCFHLYTGEYARQNQHEEMIQWQSKSTNFTMFHVYLGWWVVFSFFLFRFLNIKWTVMKMKKERK